MTSSDSSGSATAMRSVVTALRALEALSRGPLGVSALSRQLGVPKTTAHRSLQTLVLAGWVRPWPVDPSKWVLTGRSLTVGLAGSVEGSVRELARSELTDLRDATGETVHLVVPDPPDLVVVLRIDGTNSLRTFLALGTHAPLHATASGRALLAAMTDAEVSDVLDAGLSTFTPSTLHDRAEVLREIERTRARGYAVNVGEWRPDIAALGVAVVSRTGLPVAAVAISMPVTRYAELDVPAIAESVIGAARRISEHLAEGRHSDTWP